MTQTVRFVDSISYTEADQADFNMRMMRPQGVIPESVLGTLIVSAIGSMAVRVGPGEAFVQGFQYMNDANFDLAIAGNASGSTRIDYVVLRLNRTANTLLLAILQGIAGAGAPTLTQVVGGTWEFPLAQVNVVNNASTISAGSISDTRVLSRWALSTLDAAMATDVEIAAAVATEATNRTNADTTLQTNITNETNARATADTTLQTNINNEAGTRAAVDNSLSTQITNVNQGRADGDTAEANARVAADNALSARISALESGLRIRAAAWVESNGALNAGFNIASINRYGVGQYYINLSFNMPTSSFIVLASAGASGGYIVHASTTSGTQIQVTITARSSGVFDDARFHVVAIYNG